MGHRRGDICEAEKIALDINNYYFINIDEY